MNLRINSSGKDMSVALLCWYGLGCHNGANGESAVVFRRLWYGRGGSLCTVDPEVLRLRLAPGGIYGMYYSSLISLTVCTRDCGCDCVIVQR